MSVFNEVYRSLAPVLDPILANPIISLVTLGSFVILAYGLKKWSNKPRSTEPDYDADTEWEKETPKRMKKLASNTGQATEKTLWKGDVECKGKVQTFYKDSMPEDADYMDYIHGKRDANNEEDNIAEVYVFVVRDAGFTNKLSWKLTDDVLGKNLSTRFYTIKADNVEVERDRFRYDEDVKFKLTYGKIYEQKGIATESVSDQFALYDSRKNLVEGIEEFSQKVLFLDRNHSSKIGELREDVDMEAIEKALQRGRNYQG